MALAHMTFRPKLGAILFADYRALGVGASENLLSFLPNCLKVGFGEVERQILLEALKTTVARLEPLNRLNPNSARIEANHLERYAQLAGRFFCGHYRPI
jgi:hypothetical protein